MAASGAARLKRVRSRVAASESWKSALAPATTPWISRSGSATASSRSSRLLRFGEHYRQIARPFDWTFSRADLERVLAKLTEREPRLALAA